MEFAGEKPGTSEPTEPTYRAFLLRCWREAGAWRFCLVEPGDRETERGFASLEALVAHLRRELGID